MGVIYQPRMRRGGKGAHAVEGARDDDVLGVGGGPVCAAGRALSGRSSRDLGEKGALTTGK